MISEDAGNAIDSRRNQGEGSARERVEHRQPYVADAPLAIMVVDGSGRFVEVNPAACLISGYDEAELLAMSFSDLLAQESQEPGQRHFALAKQGNRVSGAARWIRKDGTKRWSTCDAVRLSEDRFLAYCVDITGRKETEDRLQQSEQRQRAILDTVPDPAWLKDKEGRFLAVNAAWCRFFGLSDEDVLGKTAFECLTSDVAERLQEQDRGVIRSRMPSHIEESLADRDGRLYWFETIKNPLLNEHGEVIGTTGLARDITQRKRAEAILTAERDLVSRLAAAHHLKEIVRLCLDAAIRCSGLECGGIYVFDAASQRLELACHAGLSSPFVEAVKSIRPDSIRAQVIGDGQLVEMSRSRLEEVGAQAEIREGLSVLVFIPIMHEGHPAACLNIASRTATAISRHARMALEAVAGHMGAAIARARIEESLRESDDRYRSLFNKMTEGFALHEILCDANGEPCDYRFLDMNPAFEELTGLKKNEILGKTFREVLPGEDLDWIKTYGAVALTGQSTRFESHSTALGRYYDVIAYRPAPGQFATMFTDITERERAKEALRHANAYNRRLIEVSLDPLVTIGPDGKITDVNKATEEATGCSRQELIGTEFSEYFTEPEMAQAGYRQVFHEGLVRDYALSLRRRDGHVTSVLYNASVYRDEAGQVMGVFAAARDITQRKRAEEEKLEMERRLLHAQKLEGLGVLAGGIAHDFNNILAGIRMFAEAVLADLGDSTLACERLEQIKRATRQGADLTRQILTYAGKASTDLKPVDLSQIVEDMKKILEVSVSKKAVLQYSLASDSAHAHADAGQIRQVVMNLVVNASEALGGNGGMISISTRTLGVDGAHPIRVVSGENLLSGCYVCLEVRDTGCGMDRSTLEKIFDPFYTTKFAGRGLGLATVHGIVRAHKGGLEVSSEIGRGATFRVFLPAMNQPALVPAKGKPAKAIRGIGMGTVLVVDDEEMVRRGEQVLLEIAGFHVVAAGDGEEALEVFRQHREKVVCVILDMTMPRMGGEETFRELRRIDPEVRIVLTSGNTEEAMRQRFAGNEVFGFVQKPDSIDSIILKLQDSIALGGRSES